MKSDTIHIVLTRFNIKAYSPDRSGEVSDSWMASRMHIFEKYCFPSVCLQTNKNFIWLVLMEKTTSDRYKRKMSAFERVCPVMKVVYVDSQAGLYSLINESVRPYLAGHEKLLTTRLDNDDMVAPDFVEKLQIEADSIDAVPVILSFNRGVQLFTIDKVALLLDYPSNHFTSMLEPSSDDFCTIMHFDHNRAADFCKRVVLRTESPAWAELVHQSNVINDFTVVSKPRAERLTSLDFPGIGTEYLRYWHNQIGYLRYLLRYVWKYRSWMLQRMISSIASKIKGLFSL